MNITKPVVCIFPHGEEDFESSDELLGFLRNTLPKERQGTYYLRNLGRTRRFEGKSFIEPVVPGSVTLFKKWDKIWGAAVVKRGMEKLDPPEILTWVDKDGRRISRKYRFAIDFYPEAIVAYDRGITIPDIERVTGLVLTRGWLRASYLILGYSDIIEPRLGTIMAFPVRP